MACTRPSPASPRAPARHEHGPTPAPQADRNLFESHQRRQAPNPVLLLDQVRQLIVELVPTAPPSCRDAAHSTGHDATTSNDHDPDMHDVRRREKTLETTLATVLLELAKEREQLRLAAKAGTVLLHDLDAARDEVDTLHAQVHVAQVERQRALDEAQRLTAQQHTALEETAVHAVNPVYATPTSRTSRTSLTSGLETWCAQCTSRTHHVTQLEARIDALRRRCVELEVAHDKQQQRERELVAETNALHERHHEQQLETQRLRQTLDVVTLELEEQMQHVEQVEAARETLRGTLRRLEAEHDAFQARLAARDERVHELEQWKARATTQLQVAENRRVRAQAETTRVTQALETLQCQLETQQREREDTSESETDGEGNNELGAGDTEQLLAEATRTIAALRLKNRQLRRQWSADAHPNASRGRGRRRQGSTHAMTAADVLALDQAGSPTLVDPNKSSSPNEIGDSSIEPTTSLTAQLSELEVETIVRGTQPSENGTRPRRLSLKLNWVEKTATIVDASHAAENENPLASEDECTSAIVPLESAHLIKEMEGTQIDAFKSSSSMATTLKRTAELLRLRRHGNNHEWETKDAIHLPVVGIQENALVCELPLEQQRSATSDAPPTTRLYLGLSFIACATAAGLLVRR
ncbi:hypothetical protein PsorP6_007258 [Peronosclerospora sorghi]|uniref:Uncharacterized protein n=1 Tax=Peronosclerospora sorghi TaxID=230839 RepID=A0ACC0W7S9_9STRA|nr:hypothetical protein PsorP6_007258 [Peronosclerospora sorghi]